MSDDLGTHKRNLLVISIAHIVLYLSGGEFDGGSMLGGTIINANGDVLLTAAWVFFFYFFWMYWRASKVSRLGTKLYVDVRCQMPQFLKPIADQIFPEKGGSHQNIINSNHVLKRKGVSFYLITADLDPGQDLSKLPFLGCRLILWRVYLKTLWAALVYGGWFVDLCIPIIMAGTAFLCLLLTIGTALIGA